MFTTKKGIPDKKYAPSTPETNTGLGRTSQVAGGCYALCAPSQPSGSLGHPVTPPFASKAKGFAPALSKPLPPRKKRPFRQREDGLSFRFPAKGLSVCTPSLADGQGCLRSASNQKPEKKGQTMTQGTAQNQFFPRFEIGRIVATNGALAACDLSHLLACFNRHVCGDWGNVCAEDKASNDQALTEGGRILSAYPIDPTQPSKGHGKNCLWIITEADRSVTTFLLPEEY